MFNKSDKFANGKVQAGELPNWMHVSGKVAWYVFQGPYSELGSKGFSVRMSVPEFVCEVSPTSFFMTQPFEETYATQPYFTQKDDFRNTYTRFLFL